MIRKLAAPVVLVISLYPAAVRGEKPNMSPAELRETGTHIVTGTVTAVYTRTTTDKEFKYTRYVAEVKVAECEKGEGIKKGDLVYVRYWQREFLKNVRTHPDTSGHRGLPKEGALVRVYLARNAYDGFTEENHDGGFNVIGANGFEQLSATRQKRP